MFRGTKWLESVWGRLETDIPGCAQAILALIIDSRWSNITLELILNEADDARRDQLIDAWIGHRFADLNRINITVTMSYLRAHLHLTNLGRLF
jgi:hypothetical protein